MRALVLVAALAAAAALAPGASAHARLVRTEPADGATLSAAPPAVHVLFDDRVRPGPGTEAVRNGGGSVLAGRARAHGRELVIPLQPGLAHGDYSVRWRIVSDDGHLEAGVLAFAVGKERATPRSVLEAESSRPSALDVLSRLVYFAGLLVAGGAALFRFTVWKPVALTDDPAEERLSSNLLALALAAVFLGGSALLAANHGAGATRFGRVQDVAVVVAALGAAAAAIGRVYPRLLVAASAAAVALLAAPSLAGHALDAGRPRPVTFALDLVHVVAAAFWIGGLLALFLHLLRLRERTGPIARRFSAYALPAVAVIAATGVGRALFELSAVSQVWTTGYGRTIVVKSVLLAILVALAWQSRSRLVTLLRLRRSVAAELATLALVVAAVALLTALRPGRDSGGGASAAASAPSRPALPRRGSLVVAREVGDLAVVLGVARAGATVTVLGQDGRGVDGLGVRIAGRAASPCGSGCYSAAVDPHGRVAIAVAGRGSVAFELPRRPRSAAAIVRRATRVYRSLRTLVYEERLASGPGQVLETTWRVRAPDRFSYTIRGGAQGIVIGSRRWDRDTAGSPWRRSSIEPLRQPQPPWGHRVESAYVLRTTPRTWTVSFAQPSIPAWFEVTIDRRSGRTLALRMTAPAHFMRHRYLAFDRPLAIAPPAS